MSSVDIANLSKQEKDELACSYAALLLHDDGQDITVPNKPQYSKLRIG